MTYHLKYQGTVGDEDIGTAAAGLEMEPAAGASPRAWWPWPPPGRTPGSRSSSRRPGPRVLKASGEAIRKSVLKISRTKLGPLSFEGLSLGQSRDLSRAEVNALRRAAGLL